jgi:hypothetical protein
MAKNTVKDLRGYIVEADQEVAIGIWPADVEVRTVAKVSGGKIWLYGRESNTMHQIMHTKVVILD